MFLKYRDLIHETVSEFGRRGNFVRIYPSRGSKIYDKFFTASKPLNKIIYRTLFSNEILHYGGTRLRAEEDSDLISQNNRKMSQTITPTEQPKFEHKPLKERVGSSTGMRPKKPLVEEETKDQPLGYSPSLSANQQMPPR